MKGKRLSYDGLSLFYTRNEKENFRVGISVVKKQINAVQRNKVKRRLRDCIMRHLEKRTQGYDLVFVVRQPLQIAEYELLYNAVGKMLDKAFPKREAEGIPS